MHTLVGLAARESASEHAEPADVLHRIAYIALLVHEKGHLVDGSHAVREYNVEQGENDGFSALLILVEHGMVADVDALERAVLGAEPTLLGKKLYE